MSIPPTHRTVVTLAATAFILALIGAGCGDGDDADNTTEPNIELPPATGVLTDPGTAPTAAPWTIPPDPIPLNEIPPPTVIEDFGSPPTPATPEPQAEGHIYTVVSGDTAYAISLEFNITLAELADANETTIEDLGLLQVGQELIIPPSDDTVTESEPEGLPVQEEQEPTDQQ